MNIDGEAMVTDTPVADTTSEVISDGGEGAVSTDEQVLTQTEDAQGTEQVVTETEQAEQPQPTEEAIPSSAAPPEWLKAHYADPKFGKEAQRLWDSYNAYRGQFATVAEAKAVKELVSQAGTVEDLKSAIEAAQEKQASDFAYESGDPAQLEQMARDWAANPESFNSLVNAGVKVFAETNPSAYNELGLQIVEDTLSSLRATALQMRNQEAADRIEQTFKDIFGRGVGEKKGSDPRDSRYTQKAQELSQREQKIQERAVLSLAQTANNAAGHQVTSLIDPMLATALAGVKINDGAKGRIREEIYNDVNAKLKADGNLQQRLQAIGMAVKKRGYSTPQDEQQWSAAIIAKARTLLPGSAKTIVNQWTQDYLGVVKKKTDKIAGAASRTDIAGSTSPGDMGIKPLTGDKMLKMSNDEIQSYKGPIDPNWKKQMQEARARG